MRDIVILTIFFGLLPVAFMRPLVGALLFAFVSLANPHRLGWGFAYDMPLATIAAVATFAGCIVRRGLDVPGALRMYWLMVVYVLWMWVTTQFAFEPVDAQERLMKVFKIQVMVLLTLSLLRTRDDVKALAWVVVCALGFYGVKGGVFTILEGGQHRVWGPPESNINENNSLAVALLMTAPLILGLRFSLQPGWRRGAAIAAAGLCIVSALGSHSRGGLLAAAAMIGYLWLKSQSKMMSGAAILAVAIAVLPMMPQSWWDRMGSIQTYQEDESAMGRINAWTTAYRVANDRLTGGGFEYYAPTAFERYAPNPEDIHSAHSIYFQALGEHGWIGLALFLAFWATLWFRAGAVAKRLRGRPECETEVRLMDAFRVSIVAFAVGGAFLNIGNWDGAYYMALLVLGYDKITRREFAATGATTRPARASRMGAFSAGASRRPPDEPAGRPN